MDYDIIIIGGGPSGLTAGIYATRAGMRTAIIEKQFAGGQITSSENVENYPAFDSISGADLAMRMLEQTEKLGVKMIYDNVVETELVGDTKYITTANNGKLSAKAVILCTGANARKLGLANEEKFVGRGVSYCALCDGAFYRNKTVVVVGGGNTAIGDALYLSKFAKVYLVHRREGFRATKSELDKLNNSTVEVITDTIINDIVGEDKVNGVILENVKTGEQSSLTLDGVFVAIGQIPSVEGIASEVDRDKYGYIIGDEDMRTNVDGVFVAGDVRVKKVRQVVTAVSDGAIAGEMATLYIEE